MHLFTKVQIVAAFFIRCTELVAGVVDCCVSQSDTGYYWFAKRKPSPLRKTISLVIRKVRELLRSLPLHPNKDNCLL